MPLSREKRALIIGGGFIGTALCRRLHCTGWQIHLLSPSHPKAWPEETSSITHFTGRLEDVPVLQAALENCDAVIHAASTTTPGDSIALPSREIRENLTPLAGLLEAMSAMSPPPHLVFISSGGTVYGNPTHLPVPEDAPLRPISNYGAAKAAMEMFIQAYSRRLDLFPTIIRPANIYGPGQGLKMGFGIIRTLLEHARSETPIDIWGNGENIRDFLHIDDFVLACEALLQTPTKAEIYNVGSGRGISLNQLVQLVEKITGRPLTIRRGPPRTNDVHGVVLDISRIKSQTQWTPEIGLSLGMHATWKWLLAQ